MRTGAELSADTLLSVTRSSPINLHDTAGIYQPLGNNALPRTDLGLYANGQATNKCLNFNANPEDSSGLTLTSGLTVTQPVETAMIAAAGLQNICTSDRIYRVIADNTTNTLTINGAVGNTVPHILSGWLHVVSGSVQIVLVGQAALGTINANAGLVPFSFTGTPNATSRNMGFRTTANAEYYFILNQLEEGSIASPPVVVAGATATLLASDIRVVQGVRPSNGQPEPFPGWEAAGLDGGFTVLFDIEARTRQLASRRPLLFSGGTGSFRLETNTAGTGFRVYTNDGSLDGTNNFPGGLGETRRRFAVRAQGTTITTAGSGVGSVNNEARGFIQQPEALHIGNQSSLSAPWSDWLHELQICPWLPEAELLEWVNA